MDPERGSICQFMNTFVRVATQCLIDYKQLELTTRSVLSADYRLGRLCRCSHHSWGSKIHYQPHQLVVGVMAVREHHVGVVPIKDVIFCDEGLRNP